jgi:hypothetical protein
MNRILLLLAAAGAALALVLLTSRRSPDAPRAVRESVASASAERAELVTSSAVHADEARTAEPAVMPTSERETVTPLTPAASEAPRGIHGRVVLPPGTPAGEVVTVVLSRARPEQSVVVAPDGSFRADLDLTHSGCWIDIEAEHLFLPERMRVAKGSREPVVVEPRLGGRIVGNLSMPDGRERRSGSVELERVDDGERAGLVQVRSSEFRFDALAPGRYRLTFAGSAHQPGPDEVTVFAGATSYHAIELQRGVRLSGRVVSAAGEELHEVRVGLVGSALEERAPDGRFSLGGLRPGAIVLEVSCPGHLPGRFDLGALADGEERRDLELRLALGNVIAGRVEWTDGTPAAAEITWLVAGVAPDISRYRPERRTAPDGTFRIAGLGSEPVTVLAEGSRAFDATVETSDGPITVSRPRVRRGHASAEDVEPGTVGLVLVLRPHETLRGRVVDESGAPVTAARVRARRVDEVGGELRRSDLTMHFVEDAAGVFALEDLAPGTWELEVLADGFLPSEGRRVVLPSTEAVEIALQRRR